MPLTVHQAFGTQQVWIDCVVVVLLAAIHFAANWATPNLPDTPDDRARSFSFVKELTSASMTVVGILLPLSMITVGTLAGKHGTPARVLTNVFVGDVWLALSLLLGLAVLWVAGFQAHTRNVQNLRLIRLLSGLQLFPLMAGVVRLLIATLFLVQTTH